MENTDSNIQKAYVCVHKSKIVVTIAWKKADVDFLKLLKHSSYDSKENRWLISNTNENLDLIKDHFSDNMQFVDNESNLPSRTAAQRLYKNELHIVEHVKGRIKIIARYRIDLTQLIKSFPYRTWDNDNKWWTTVDSEQVIQQLENFCQNNDIKIRYFDTRVQKVSPRIHKDRIPNYRTCPKEFTEKLIIMRYSESTISSYSSSFEEFINFFHHKKVTEISEPDILEFLRYLVVDRHVSSSYQNVSINAIKFYYEKVLGESRKFYYVERPRKEKTLPVVLNKDEISKMIKLTDNVKHKSIIMLIYSAGLRVSEAINIRIEDIDSKRMMIHIKGAKGKKDRTTLLSEKTLVYLREYYKLYSPEEYLFTGQYGGMYAASSILKIVKTAAKKAGVKKSVSTHTLLHSFATHLLEQGVNLRYIQSLLGHESSKTTEIYTHINSRSFDGIASPLDDLDI